MFSSLAYSIATYIEPLVWGLIVGMTAGVSLLYFFPRPGFIVRIGSFKWRKEYLCFSVAVLSGDIILSAKPYLALGQHTFLQALAVSTVAAVTATVFGGSLATALHLRLQLAAYTRGSEALHKRLQSMIQELEAKLEVEK